LNSFNYGEGVNIFYEITDYLKADLNNAESIIYLKLLSFITI